MLTTYLNSLHEGFAKRTALVMLGLALLMAITLNRMTQVDASRPASPQAQAEQAKMIAQAVSRQLVSTTGIWMLVATFAAAGMLSTTLEKGWLELLFSKGTRRWQILLARLAAGATLFGVAFSLANVPLAARFWWVTGVPTWSIGVAVLLEILAFVSLLSVAALASLPQKGPALPIMAAVMTWMLSPVLEARKQIFYPIFTSDFSHRVLDWLYRILPKGNELHNLAIAYIRTAKITDWWPVWSTAVFVAATLLLVCFLLERKSF